MNEPGIRGGDEQELRQGAIERPPAADVQLTGTVFFDLVFSGLAGPPGLGQEVYSAGLGSSPGGVANLAVACARLGLSVRLDAAFATDLYGDYLWRTLGEQEGIDLSGSHRFPGWSTPVTVSMGYGSDRTMVTHECPAPPPLLEFLDDGRPTSRSTLVSIGPDSPDWVGRAKAAGMRVFADTGWDGTGRWSVDDLAPLEHVEAFLPSRVEAMAYTRTATPEAAAEALLERAPLVVVKCGGKGVVAGRAGDPDLIHEPAIDVQAFDPTGAGDVFDAAFIYASLAGWPLGEALRFGNLNAGLSVRHHGGSLSAPDWADIAAWIDLHPAEAPRYQFLRPNVDRLAQGAAHERAHPTI